MAEIASLIIADPPELWEGLGFVVDGGACWVSGLRLVLGGPGSGVGAWTLRGVEGLDELAVAAGEPPDPEPTPDHLNGVRHLDHVVVDTPDLGRTIDAFESAGLRLRRTRDAGTADRSVTQAFFRLGATIVEVVTRGREAGAGRAAFWGLAFSVVDLDATATVLGSRLRQPTDAVQPGRRIATLERTAGSTVPMAFMSVPPDRVQKM